MDAAKVRIFLNFSEGKTRDRWVEGELVDADVWLAASDAPIPQSRQPVVVVRLADADTGMVGLSGEEIPVLHRPLQLEHFQEFMLQVEAGRWSATQTTTRSESSTADSMAVKSHRDHGDWDVDTIPSQLMDPGPEEGAITPSLPPLPQKLSVNGSDASKAERKATAAAVEDHVSFIATASHVEAPSPSSGRPAAPPARPVVGPNKASAAEALPKGFRFRLKRWPTAINLARHIYLPRLASFLVTRHLSVAELSRLSHVSVQECEAFLSVMDSLGILDLKEMSGSDAAADAAARNSEFGDSQSPTTTVASVASNHQEAAHGSHAKHKTSQATVAVSPRSGSVLGLVGRLRSRLGLS
jgi:hypothetical protein